MSGAGDLVEVLHQNTAALSSNGMPLLGATGTDEWILTAV